MDYLGGRAMLSTFTTTRGTRLVAALACIPGAALMASVAQAQTWPSKPIRWIVPFAPGGGVDVTTRTIAQRLATTVGQQFIVDNRGGANGNIGVELATKAAPDGHTLLMATTGNITINPHIYSKLTFDPVRDLIPVIPAVDVINALVVHPTLPVKSVKELIALAKKRPGELNYGSSGPGGSDHIATELFASHTGTKLTNISYKGGAPAMLDLVAGNIHMMIATMAVAVGPIKAGRLRPLGVTSNKRFELMPEIPTISEAGAPGYEAVFWFGTFVPAGTPREIVTRLNSEIGNAIRVPEVRQRLLESGLVATGGGVEAFSGFVKAESSKWAKLVREKGIRVD
jgi:tripartite-type tricarboxylate transporter receptor subunit TctC